uniref:Uncharacterized protein n=1 Tax=Rhizophora mucronata TaxID=61149 RepID=A0A2P2Q9W7_RHIMU
MPCAKYRINQMVGYTDTQQLRYLREKKFTKNERCNH